MLPRGASRRVTVLLAGIMLVGQNMDHWRFFCGKLDRQMYVRLCSVKSGKLNSGQLKYGRRSRGAAYFLIS